MGARHTIQDKGRLPFPRVKRNHLGRRSQRLLHQMARNLHPVAVGDISAGAGLRCWSLAFSGGGNKGVNEPASAGWVRTRIRHPKVLPAKQDV